MIPRSKRHASWAWLGFVALVVGACGPGEVVITTEVALDDPGGGGRVARPLASLEVRLLPFDREAVVDSLRAAFGRPEPPIPSVFLAARAEARAAEGEWHGATARWNAVRDTMQKITAVIERFDRGELRYAELFQEFEAFDVERAEVEASMDAAFRRFSELRRVALHQADSIRILRETWADEALAQVDAVLAAHQRAAGLVPVVDTTDADGVAAGGPSEKALRVRPGRYWVQARYELPDAELFWNLPISVERGDPIRVHLTRDNAEERIRL